MLRYAFVADGSREDRAYLFDTLSTLSVFSRALPKRDSRGRIKRQAAPARGCQGTCRLGKV